MEVTSNIRPGFQVKITRPAPRKATKMTLRFGTGALANGAIDLNGREAREMYEALDAFYTMASREDKAGNHPPTARTTNKKPAKRAARGYIGNKSTR